MDIDEHLLLVREEDREAIRLFFEKENLTPSETAGKTLLHLVSQYGTKKLVKICLRNGFNVNALDSLGRTPMTLALRYSRVSIMWTFIMAGADIFLHDPLYKSPLHELFEGHSLDYEVYDIYFKELEDKYPNSEEMAQVMLDHGCHLYQAAFTRDVKIIEYVLNHGFQMNTLHPFYKTSALHIAVELEDDISVNALINYGLDVQALDVNNDSPIVYLYKSCSRHSAVKIKILEALLNAGVSPMSRASNGLFHIASILGKGNLKAIRILLQWNINFSARDGKKRSVLHYLAINTNSRVIEEVKRIIVDAKLSINEIDGAGMTPLHFAVMHQNVEMVRFLLEQGASPNYTSSTGLTALFYCGYLGHESRLVRRDEENFELLLLHHADPQFISHRKNGSKITVLDNIVGFTPNQLKYVIAHLAIVEGLGTPINKIIYNKIITNRENNKYFKRCQWILNKCVHESVTVLQLLTANEEQVAKYLSNKSLVLKLKRIFCKHQVKSSFSYYFNTIKMRFSKGFKHRMLKKEATEIIGNVFERCSIRNDLIVAETLKYFSHNDLQQLYILNK